MGFLGGLLRLAKALWELAPAEAEAEVAGGDAVQRLAHGSVAARKKAAQALRAGRDPATLGALIEALSDPDAGVRREVAVAIYGFGRDGLPALPALLRLCNDADPAVRVWGLTTLAPGALNPPSEEVFPVLMARLQDDPSPEVRREALAILSSHLSSSKPELRDMFAPLLLQALRDPDMEVRRHAAFTIGWDASHFVHDPAFVASATKALIALLRETDAMLLFRASTALSRVDPTCTDGIPALVQLIRRPAIPSYLSESAAAAARIKGPAAEALRELARSPDPGERLRGACALLAFPDERPAALKVVVAVVSGGRPAILREALESVRMFHMSAEHLEPIRPVVLQALRADEEAQRLALRLLQGLAPDEGSTALVLAMARSVGHPLRGEALETLGSLCRPPVALPVMREALQDRGESVRRQAAMMIGRMREDAAAALPDLLALLRSDPKAASYLLFPLGALGPGAREAIPLVLDLLDSPDGYTRDRAAEALESIGVGEALGVPALAARIERAMMYGNSGTRRAMARAALRAGKQGAPLARSLGELLQDADAELRRTALDALLALGPGAHEALGALLRVMPGLNDFQARSLLKLLAEAGPVPASTGDVLVSQLRARPPSFLRDVLVPLESLGAQGILPLLEATQSGEEYLCVDATHRLERLGPAHLDALESALHHADPSLRLRAVGALGQLGAAAHPVLRRALDHQDELVRDQAAIMLG